MPSSRASITGTTSTCTSAGARIRSGGHGFCGIERKRLLNIFQERAAALGVEQSFCREVDASADVGEADLIVAADGVNSVQRARHAAVFKPHIDVRKCRFIWLGTHQKFPAFTFAFERTEHGWFQIHAYQFSKDLSTVIVETREETWKAHGLDRFGTEQSIAFCERLFGAYLGGHRLMSNARHLRGSAWLNFNRVLCERWHHGNLRAHRRCRPHGAFRHRLGHEARHGGCDVPGSARRAARAMSAPRSTPTTRSATSRP